MVVKPICATALIILGFLIPSRAEPPQLEPARPGRLFPFREPGKDGKWGYIDRDGAVIVAPRFRQALDFRDGLARVSTEQGLRYIDAGGKTAFVLRFKPGEIEWTHHFAEGLLAFSVKDKCGYIDRYGRVAIEPQFDQVRDFSEGLAAVNIGATWKRNNPPYKDGGKWGFIDKTGRMVIAPQFSYVEYHGFSDGLARVSIDDKSAYIDKSGKVVFRPEFKSDDPKRWISSSDHFTEGLAHVRTSAYEGPFSGFVDKSGKFVIEPRFDAAREFSDGLAAVVIDKKWGYIDRTGRVAIKPQFDAAGSFSEGLATVQIGEDRGCIDKAGNVAFRGPYNETSAFAGGLARVHEGGRFVHLLHRPGHWVEGTWYYINAKGKKVRVYRTDDD